MSVSSSSWCLGRAAACDYGTPWTFLLSFLYTVYERVYKPQVGAGKILKSIDGVCFFNHMLLVSAISLQYIWTFQHFPYSNASIKDQPKIHFIKLGIHQFLMIHTRFQPQNFLGSEEGFIVSGHRDCLGLKEP